MKVCMEVMMEVRWDHVVFVGTMGGGRRAGPNVICGTDSPRQRRQ